MTQYPCSRQSLYSEDGRCRRHKSTSCGLQRCASRIHLSICRTMVSIIKYERGYYRVSVDVANVADVALVIILCLLLVSQLCERINDNTEQDIDHNNNNDNVECAIECKLHKVPIRKSSLMFLTSPCCHMKEVEQHHRYHHQNANRRQPF